MGSRLRRGLLPDNLEIIFRILFEARDSFLSLVLQSKFVQELQEIKLPMDKLGGLAEHDRGLFVKMVCVWAVITNFTGNVLMNRGNRRRPPLRLCLAAPVCLSANRLVWRVEFLGII